MEREAVLCKSGLRYLKSETQILVTSIATKKIRKKNMEMHHYDVMSKKQYKRNTERVK